MYKSLSLEKVFMIILVYIFCPTASDKDIFIKNVSRTLYFELNYHYIYTYLLYSPKTSLISLFLRNYSCFVKYEIKVNRGKCKFGFGVNVNIYNKYNLKYFSFFNYFFFQLKGAQLRFSL